MKIDFYISSLSGGGAEKVLTTLAKSFSDCNHDVSITSLEKRPQFYEVDSRVEMIKYDNTKRGKVREIIGDYRAVKKQVKNRNPDIIISFLSRCNLLVLLCSLFTMKNVIVCDRNNPLKEHSRLVFWLSCIIYARAQKVIVQTNEIKSFYPKFLQSKLIVIENPIDTVSLISQVNDFDIQKENTIISIGRLENQKDFKTLIKAFSMLSQDYTDWKLKIFGVGYLKDDLEKYIEQLNVSGQVELCGRTTKPFYELKKSKVFVLSSYYEGFPNVLCEAMFAGLPCISTNCVSGPKELIDNGQNGILVPVEGVYELYKSLTNLLSNESNRIRLGKAASESVKRLHLEKIVEKWNSILWKTD